MKKAFSPIKEKLAERLELPENILSDEPYIELWAGKKARVENHRGIAVYSPQLIEIRTAGGGVRLKGSELRIDSLISEEIVITGIIVSAEII